MWVLDVISRWAIPFLLFTIPLVGLFKGIRVYETFVTGAEQGFITAIKIIPFLVGMLTAIGVFRASGAMDYFVDFLSPLLQLLHFPPEILPLAIMRPLSGGGSLGIAAELIHTYGPDSFIGRLASTMQGSTDTTFYIITVYFGSVGIKKYRYAITLGLIADLTTLLAAIFITNLLFPS
ncbi:spore maturation protein [Zhaonella formicivorans]|uniref:spore maturation protein n=1 Tax=Zhaonella formicivorans TaxID=2528593 RepID=UPI0010DD7B91|nr:spore maturation protein [Zhaonella formicivorans]